ncbi:MAG: O-acetyl-ADP-ribose deacetylase [Deltaproteobacteria bacterium]|nr:O-acetyl-ADP-ribose deacetylase [Deltaproteobacteria bacterium]
MRVMVNGVEIELVRGDITAESSDAIVNAANSALAGGGGVDHAIHRAGGDAIMRECARFGGCPTGSAVITTGGELKARYVIHTVGPIYVDGQRGEPQLLASAYASSLRLALDNGIKTISFPSISTGVYGYPIGFAARIALETVFDFVMANKGLRSVRFVLFSERDLAVYSKALERLAKGG